MKTRIKELFLILIVVVISQCKEDIDPYVTITDNHFLNALKERGVDKNSDGIISPDEAAEVTFLNVSECSISDLKGIEAFVNLDSLICDQNGLTSLDVSNNIALRILTCSTNRLFSLNVSNNAVLQEIECTHNLLTSLDISNNPVLNILYCDGNLLSSLDLSNNNIIEYLTLTSMPSLTEICVWTMPFPPAGVTVDKTGSPNAYFTRDCN